MLGAGHAAHPHVMWSNHRPGYNHNVTLGQVQWIGENTFPWIRRSVMAELAFMARASWYPSCSTT